MLALAIGARLLQFAGAVILFGAALYPLYAGPKATASSRMMWAAVAAVLAGALAFLSAQTASMTGAAADAFRPSAMWDVASGTGVGRGVLMRLALTAAFAVALAARARALPLALIGGAVAASFAWTGHGAGEDGVPGLVHQGADVAHLLTGAAWLGALAVLTAAVLSREPDVEALHRGLEGFSTIGPGVVGVLVLSGLVNSVFLVGLEGLPKLATSPYGLILLAKLLLFALMLALAWANRRRLTPNLGLALAGSPAEAVRALRKSLVAEAVLGLAVLGAVAALGMLEPVAHS